LVLLMAALLANGCWKKKPVVAAPPPAPRAPAPATVPPPAPVEPPKPVKPRAAAPPKPVPPPALLGEVLSAGERARFEKQIGADLEETHKILAALASKRLTPEQAQSAERIRAFARQAAEARGGDPRPAAELARRAVVTARGLAGVVR